MSLGPEDPLAGLNQWLAEGSVDAAARARTRQRWLERQAAEEATVASPQAPRRSHTRDRGPTLPTDLGLAIEFLVAPTDVLALHPTVHRRLALSLSHVSKTFLRAPLMSPRAFSPPLR